jgi:hypothetical protein
MEEQLFNHTSQLRQYIVKVARLEIVGSHTLMQEASRLRLFSLADLGGAMHRSVSESEVVAAKNCKLPLVHLVGPWTSPFPFRVRRAQHIVNCAWKHASQGNTRTFILDSAFSSSRHQVVIRKKLFFFSPYALAVADLSCILSTTPESPGRKPLLPNTILNWNR